MMWGTKIFIFLLGTLWILEAVDTSASNNDHSTVIEKNHFYSNYEVNTTYNITKVNKDKPIILFLKKKD